MTAPLPASPTDLPSATHHDFAIPVAAGDVSIEIPVIVLRGARPGPRLTLIGGVHGDEFDGPRALMRLATSLDPGALVGTLVIAPVVNIPAFRACARVSPVDGLNLNRVFPGNPAGSITERLAHAIVEQLVRGSDAVFSMHGSSAWALLDPWVEFQHVESPVGLASYRMARAAGFANLFPLPYAYDPGLLIFAAYDLGIPCIEGERGGNGANTPAQVDAYVDSAHRTMGHLGMMAPISSPPPPAEVHDHIAISAGADGFWEAAVSPGAAVVEGEPLGTLFHLRGTRIETPRAPFTGRVMSVRTRPPTATGDRLAAIGRSIELSSYFEGA